ncbi:MAG: GFA family protein [Roseibium sp.]|nr:GFA family protein [Roseibium sp.]
MNLSGSCHCGAIRFSVQSRTPYPFMRCHCSICRKTAGGGGYAINLMGAADTLVCEDPNGAQNTYQAIIDGEQSPAQRVFCGSCGSHLWLWDPRWPELIHPQASAIDTPLPVTPETVQIMLDAKPSWVDLATSAPEKRFDTYPDLSIEDWHKTHGLYESDDP